MPEDVVSSVQKGRAKNRIDLRSLHCIDLFGFDPEDQDRAQRHRLNPALGSPEYGESFARFSLLMELI